MNGAGLASAQQALAAGDAQGALRLLEGVRDPAALHLRAIALRRAGRPAEARPAFEQALAAAPGDPHVANNFANLLRQSDPAAALALYDRALAAQPDYRDAAFNKALLLQDMDRPESALPLLEQLCAASSGDARAHSARGGVLRALQRHREAAGAYERALAAQPDLATALKGRAQVALERGQDDAAAHFRRALAADPGDLGTVHGLAEALEAAGSDEAGGLLEQVLTLRPEWVEGHALLSRMRAEQGEADFAAAFRAAVAAQPDDHALALALAATLASGEKWAEAVAVLPADPGFDGVRAHYLVEAGDPATALALLKGDDPASRVTVARAHYRLGDPGAAVATLERAVADAPDSIAAWGLLELGWRLTGHPRAAWLSGQPGLFGTSDIGLDEGELTRLAAVLRTLHCTRAHPIGQSLRGGTQTRGRLFLRAEPELARLHRALDTAVSRHVAALPPADPGHPLLRHRDAAMAIAGSWSVRLSGSGFHVNHIHQQGLLSSACYIALPPGLDDAETREGWLELGRPPPELGLALEPLATIAPRPGRLALFPSYLFHGTRPFADGERLTVAFDAVVR